MRGASCSVVLSILCSVVVSLWLSTDNIFKLRRDLVGPLSRLVTSSSIVSANEKVQSVLESKERTQSGRKGQRYSKLSPELKAGMGRQAAEHGVAATDLLGVELLSDVKITA